MSNNRFQPVKGLEETILRMPYKEGYICESCGADNSE